MIDVRTDRREPSAAARILFSFQSTTSSDGGKAGLLNACDHTVMLLTVPNIPRMNRKRSQLNTECLALP